MRKATQSVTALALLTGALLVLAPATLAVPSTSKQRIVMEVTASGPAGGPFVLTPEGSGPLKPDTGKWTFVASKKEIVRGGQSVTRYTSTTTWAGKLGTLVLRERFDDVAAGRGYRVGTGTWSPVTARGTGQYAKVTGAGRSAYVLTPHQGPYGRWEGTVRSP